MGKVTQTRYGEKVERIEPPIPARRLCGLCGCFIDEEQPSDDRDKLVHWMHTSCRADMNARIDVVLSDMGPPRYLGRFDCAGRYIFQSGGIVTGRSFLVGDRPGESMISPKLAKKLRKSMLSDFEARLESGAITFPTSGKLKP